MTASRIFLLSPAFCGGERAKLLFNPSADFALAVRLRSGGVPIGELFAFLSGLYFRGKLAYARAFARAPRGAPGLLVITPTRGLVDPVRSKPRRTGEVCRRGHWSPHPIGFGKPSPPRPPPGPHSPPIPATLLGSNATAKSRGTITEAFRRRIPVPWNSSGSAAT